MPKFKTFEALEQYLLKNFQQVLAKSKDVERIMAEAMSQAVLDVVYAYYLPKQYERRADEDGLSDVRNMGITNYGINEDGDAYIIFENLTEGNFTLEGKYTTDTIVEGIEENWDFTGRWMDRRDFVSETAKRLRENPFPLLDAFKKALIAKGFNVK